METGVLETKLAELQEQNKKNWKELESATGAQFEEIKQRITNVQRQCDAIDISMAERLSAGPEEKGLKKILEENESVARLLRDRKGQAVIEVPRSLLEVKTTIDSPTVGRSTSGVLTIERTPGIVPEARQKLTIRDALTARPTSMQIVDFVKVNSPLSAASMQTEAAAKAENAVTFTTASERVKTIATWIPCTRQVLDDFSELMGFLQTGLSYALRLREEAEILHGAGAGEDLNGLVTQATAFNTALLPVSPGWQRIDIVARCLQQVAIAKEVQPTFIVLHPTDYWNIRLTKDSQGRYLIPLDAPMNLFGLNWIVTVSMGSGNFLVGSGDPAAAEIRDRMGLTVDISDSHSDYFTKNLLAIRIESRLALVCYRPGSFLFGSFTSSPAS